MNQEFGTVIEVKNGVVKTNVGNYKLEYFTFDPQVGDKFIISKEGKEFYIDLVDLQG